MSLLRRALVASLALTGLTTVATPAHAWLPPVESCSGSPEVCVEITPHEVSQSVSVASAGFGTGHVHAVVGWVDLYEFRVRLSRVYVSCVVLDRVGSAGDPCAAAGGTFVRRTATLVDTSFAAPEIGPLQTVRVCTAYATVTVANIGIVDFPAYTIC